MLNLQNDKPTPKLCVDFNYINDKMLIGGLIHSQKGFDQMAALGITHMVCLLEEEEHHHDTDYKNPTNVKLLCASTGDDHLLKSMGWHQQIIEFVLGALLQPNSRIYMHCAVGMSRSALGWYTVLRALGFKPNRATTLIARARPIVTFWPDYLAGAEEALKELGYVKPWTT